MVEITNRNEMSCTFYATISSPLYLKTNTYREYATVFKYRLVEKGPVRCSYIISCMVLGDKRNYFSLQPSLMYLVKALLEVFTATIVPEPLMQPAGQAMPSTMVKPSPLAAFPASNFKALKLPLSVVG